MTRKRFGAAIATALSIAAVMVPAGVANAAGNSNAGAEQCVPNIVSGGRYSISFDNFDRGPEWMVGGESPGTLTLTRTNTASNTFSVSASVDVAAVSASVGFDVTQSNAVATSYSYVMPAEPPGVRYRIEAGTRDDVYVYDVAIVDCAGNRTGEIVRGLADKVGYPIYRTRQTF